ncbi:MAG TPA: class I SAM-dependent methyltransferase [Tepidiformaceae bacterium]|nr:class I SAM-dependent methyltransferase [Tepidiformaceae bacterium]
MTTPARDLHEDNRKAWNEATKAHNSHKGDQARFLREGGSTLFPEEVELLGDLAGKWLLHLQCNAGQDTLSLAKLGALCTGVDISDEAIAFAQQLSSDAAIPATFVRADVYDYLGEAVARGDQFDRVFSSYGTVCWLSDITSWARGIACLLAPAGRFVLIDFHPFANMFNEKLELDWPYFSGGAPLGGEGVGDYVAYAKDGLVPWGYEEGVTGFRNPHAGHEFAWGIADVVTALLGAGLRLESLREYPYANGCPRFDGQVEGEGRRFYMPPGVPAMPLMYAVVAAMG